MRKLILLRHAKSAWPDVPDQERPLARRGQRDAPVVGNWLRAAGHVPDQVLCSTAWRARETWQLVQRGLGAEPPVSFEDAVYQGSAVQLLERVRRTPAAAGALLVVGHDPALPGLALMLAATPSDADARPGGTGPPAAFADMREKFPTAAAAILEFTVEWDRLRPAAAQLTAFVKPRDLRKGAGPVAGG
jgi:phosphohistidine phosphatase